MKNYTSLTSLVNRLTDEELKSLKKYLRYQVDRGGNKSIQLLELILTNNQIQNRQIQNLLYGKINDIAFRKLVERLKLRILDVILFDSNLSNNVYPERTRIIFELRKKLIQSDLLSQKGLRDEADSLCRKVISKAKIYELYDIISQALLIRQRFTSIRKRIVEVNKISKEIEENEFKNKSFLKCQLEYNSIINKISNARNKTEYYNELIKSIEFLRLEYTSFKSQIVYFYLNMLQTELNQTKDNYFEANKHLNNLVALIKKKSVYSVNRMGTVLLNISNNYLHLGDYNSAISNAESSRPYFIGNVINTSLVDEHLFYSYFYMNNLIDSTKIVLRQLNSPNANNLNTSIYKWNYFMACLHFKNADYSASLKILFQLDDQRFNHEEWRINKRLLEIMCLIEIGDFEQVDINIESFGRYFKRITKLNRVRLRFRFIIKTLLKLANSNFDFNLVYLKRKNQISLLESDLEEFKWKPKDAELVPFNNWYKSKLSKTKIN